MPSYIQIGDDPTRWFVTDGVNADQLTGQPLTVPVDAPLVGTLVLSPRSASVAIFDTPDPFPPPADMNVTAKPNIYVPTVTGADAGHTGYELSADAPANLPEQIATSMGDGHAQTVTLAGGTLVLNGATLSFVVVTQGSGGDSSAHG